jgi:hypothetical protein
MAAATRISKLTEDIGGHGDYAETQKFGKKNF